MRDNIPVVWISDGKEHAGWMDLNKFLSDEELVEHWQVLYCLLICSELTYQNVAMKCVEPMQLRDWMQDWEYTKQVRQAVLKYSQNYLPPNLLPVATPSARQLSAI
jgi:hypothetical protein